MKYLKILLLAAVVIGTHLGLVWFLDTPSGIQPIEDDHDRGVYLQRGSWLPRQQVPYLEVRSEYPEVATWFCAIPYLFLKNAPAAPAAYKGRPPAWLAHDYLNLYSAMMAVVLLLLIGVTAILARQLGNDPRRAWFLLLPGTLYFSLSRYDAVPALLISTAVVLLVWRRHLLATFVLSLAVLTKWYPILFLPFFLNYTKNALQRPILPALILSAVTAAAILGTTFVSSGLRYQEIAALDPTPDATLAQLEAGALPPSIAGLVERLPDSLQPFATGGLRGVLTPYLHQGARITNAGGIYYQMQTRWFAIPQGSPTEAWILRGLTLGQFLILLFGLFVPMRNPHQLVRWMCLGTACFVLFAKFYSPQWVIWTTALAAPFMKNRLLIATTVAIEIFLYVQMAIIRGTPLKGHTLKDGTMELSELWYHLYDARIALTLLFTLLCVVSIVRCRTEIRDVAAA